MIKWFETNYCIRNGLSGNYPGRSQNWITGCSVRENNANRYNRIRKCTFCAGPEGIILLLNCLVRRGGCVLAGTWITMADGSRRRIEEVEVGERVRACVIESETILDAKVGRVAGHRPEEMGDYHLRLNGVLGITPYHPMYANEGWIPAGGLIEGDILLTSDGKRQVESIEVVYDRAPVFDLMLDGPIGYIADNIVVPTKIGFASYFRGIGSHNHRNPAGAPRDSCGPYPSGCTK